MNPFKIEKTCGFEAGIYPPSWWRLWPWWNDNHYDDADAAGLYEFYFGFSMFQFRLLYWRKPEYAIICDDEFQSISDLPECLQFKGQGPEPANWRAFDYDGVLVVVYRGYDEYLAEIGA